MNAFVTGIGTDIGKTYVTCGLLRHLRATGRPVAGLKPVVSGFDPAELAGSDPALLLDAAGWPTTLEAVSEIAPFRFAAPLSPAMAASAENRSFDYNALLGYCRAELDQPDRLVLIEGVGGVMTPLDPTRTVLDWTDDLHLPVVLVAGTYLGALSHTLSALAALRSRCLHVACVVVNQTPGSMVDFESTMMSIKDHSGYRTIPLGRGQDEHPAVFGKIADCIG